MIYLSKQPSPYKRGFFYLFLYTILQLNYIWCIVILCKRHKQMEVMKRMETYKIVRMFKDPRRKNKVIKTGLTLTQAQEHCKDPKTCKDGVWFDGYTKESK